MHSAIVGAPTVATTSNPAGSTAAQSAANAVLNAASEPDTYWVKLYRLTSEVLTYSLVATRRPYSSNQMLTENSPPFEPSATRTPMEFPGFTVMPWPSPKSRTTDSLLLIAQLVTDAKGVEPFQVISHIILVIANLNPTYNQASSPSPSKLSTTDSAPAAPNH